MSDKTLGKARGLNSIADPRDFKGTPGRRRRAAPDTDPPPPPPPPTHVDDQAPAARRHDSHPDRPVDPDTGPSRDQSAERTQPGVAPDRFDREADRPPPAPTDRVPPAVSPTPTSAGVEPVAATPPHRAVTPGINRKRRELSVPHKIADAVERTGINPADVVMSGYRNHRDAIYAGAGGRMVARGRTRLRLSISDAEFEQLTRLGQARGWNRSETVSVILALELLSPDPAGTSSHASA